MFGLQQDLENIFQNLILSDDKTFKQCTNSDVNPRQLHNPRT